MSEEEKRHVKVDPRVLWGVLLLLLGVPTGNTFFATHSLSQSFTETSIRHDERLMAVEKTLEKTSETYDKISTALDAQHRDLRRELADLRKQVNDNANELNVRTRPVGMVDSLSQRLTAVEAKLQRLFEDSTQ